MGSGGSGGGGAGIGSSNTTSAGAGAVTASTAPSSSVNATTTTTMMEDQFTTCKCIMLLSDGSHDGVMDTGKFVKFIKHFTTKMPMVPH